MTVVEIDTPRERALKVLGETYSSSDQRDAHKAARAQAFATLAVADSIDRLTEAVKEESK